MANRKVATKKAVQESVTAAKEAATASVVKKDAPKKPAKPGLVAPKTQAQKEAAVPTNKRAARVAKVAGASPAKIAGSARVAVSKAAGDKVRAKDATIAPKGGRPKRVSEKLTTLTPPKTKRATKPKLADLSDAEQTEMLRNMIKKNSAKMHRRG